MKKYDLYFSREEIKNREDVKPFSTFLSESDDHPDLYAVNQRTGSVVKPQ